MERLGERDRVLLGYSCSDPLGNLHRPPQHHRNSDVEFADVFGGPPRRSSFYETRRSRADSLDARARPPPPSTEKPTFGELGIPARRRLLGDDFYDDILPGSEFRLPTPRKLDRDPFPSSPGSRILSPNRHVFVGASSMPPQLSLPKTKLANSVDADFDNSSFLHSPTTSRAVPVHGDLRTLDHAFYRQSPLASQLSCGISRSSETFSKGSLSERYAPSLEGYFNNNQFHFSIYRWAGKGLSLSLSSLSEKTNVTGRYGRFPEVVIQSVELPSDDDDYMSTSPGISNNQTINHKNKVINDIFSVSKHEADLSFPEYLSELDPNYLSKSYTGNAGSETLNEHEKEDGGQQDATDGFRVKLQKQRQNSEHAGSISPRMEDIPVSLEEKMHKQHGSRVKGRAKGFIKIFNIEGSFSKRKGIFESGESKSKEKDRVKSKVGVQVSTPAAEANDKVKAVPPHDGPSVIYPVEVNEMLESEGIPSLYMSSNVPITKDPSPEWSKTSGPSCKNNNVPACKFEESHFEDLEACLVEQLPQKQLKDEQSASKHEEIAIANRKIQEWSKGKEGNIRSLLSTLQYVLWSGSGWKPVPLVDIIEGPSVKRAYQKALLCLHPDKLQQRGAAEHQKYIAEKVFDILQEAWDQFNSLSDAF